MTLEVSSRLLCAVVGLALYVFASGKWSELGRIIFAVGMFAVVTGSDR
jgi:hypothetical protein